MRDEGRSEEHVFSLGVICNEAIHIMSSNDCESSEKKTKRQKKKEEQTHHEGEGGGGYGDIIILRQNAHIQM